MRTPPVELSPGVQQHLDSLRSFYSRQQEPQPLSTHYTRQLAHRYNLLINANDSVLEIGCGEGSLLNLLHGRLKCGIDLSVEQVARGKKLHPTLDLRVGAGEKLSLDDGPFDVIVLSDVLNQAGDVEVLLQCLHDVSHAGTRLIINIHNTLWRGQKCTC